MINATSVYGTPFPANWFADAYTAMPNSKTSGGLWACSTTPAASGSLKSFVQSSTSAANTFALISQNTVSTPAASMPKLLRKGRTRPNRKKLQEALDAMSASKQMVQPENKLDPFIYFDDGSSIDTNNNILTTKDGKRIDITTGLEVIDTSSIMRSPTALLSIPRTTSSHCPTAREIDIGGA